MVETHRVVRGMGKWSVIKQPRVDSLERDVKNIIRALKNFRCPSGKHKALSCPGGCK